MTKKDYEIVALCLRKVANDNEKRMADEHDKQEAADTLYSVYMEMAYNFEQENPRFSRNKFYEAIFSEYPRFKDFIK